MRKKNIVFDEILNYGEKVLNNSENNTSDIKTDRDIRKLAEDAYDDMSEN